jgi:hypothetical protein
LRKSNASPANPDVRAQATIIDAQKEQKNWALSLVYFSVIFVISFLGVKLSERNKK